MYSDRKLILRTEGLLSFYDEYTFAKDWDGGKNGPRVNKLEAIQNIVSNYRFEAFEIIGDAPNDYYRQQILTWKNLDLNLYGVTLIYKEDLIFPEDLIDGGSLEGKFVIEKWKDPVLYAIIGLLPHPLFYVDLYNGRRLLNGESIVYVPREEINLIWD